MDVRLSGMDCVNAINGTKHGLMIGRDHKVAWSID